MMTYETADNIFSVLKHFASVNESLREDFIYEMMKENPTSEFRVQGLSFGTKYRPKKNKIDCYAEELTQNKNAQAIIDETNAKLAEVMEHSLATGKKITDDELVFGKNAFVYCDSHCRAHSTGWCTVPVRDKVKLEATNIEDAMKEVKEKQLHR